MLKIIFAGTPVFASTILQALLNGPHSIIGVYTQPDRPSGRGQHLQASAVKELAEQHQLPVYQPVSFQDQSTQKELAALKADVMVVAVYGILLPQIILDTPRLGCINVHASLLPRWRGAAPIARAIAAGDTLTGITMMQMQLALDTGPILEQFPLPITASDTNASLSDRLALLSAEHINETLTKLEKNQFNPIPQNETEACYAAKLSKAEGRIHWEDSAEKIARTIRAFNPWPVMFSELSTERVQIWQACALENSTHHTLPGSIITLSEAGIDVATGTGILRLQEIQLAGKRPIHTPELFKTKHPLFKIGQRFQ